MRDESKYARKSFFAKGGGFQNTEKREAKTNNLWPFAIRDAEQDQVHVPVDGRIKRHHQLLKKICSPTSTQYTSTQYIHKVWRNFRDDGVVHVAAVVAEPKHLPKVLGVLCVLFFSLSLTTWS